MKLTRGKHLLTIVCLFFFLSCAKENSNEHNANLKQQAKIIEIENVPFIKQQYRFCGPAALTSVAKHYGTNVEQDEVAKQVYTSELKGSLISDMKHYAKELGFHSETLNGDLEDLRLLIDQKIPVILLVDRGKLGVAVQHYYVVYGYSLEKSHFLIHDGKKRGNLISSKKLDKEWKKMSRLMLVIRDEI